MGVPWNAGRGLTRSPHSRRVTAKACYFLCCELPLLQFFSCSRNSLDELKDLPHWLHLCWLDCSDM